MFLWIHNNQIVIVIKICFVACPVLSYPLCDGTRNFDRDQDRDQGLYQKYAGTWTKAGTRNMTGSVQGLKTWTKFGPGPGLGPGLGLNPGP